MQFPKVTCVTEKLAEREEGNFFFGGRVSECLSGEDGRRKEEPRQREWRLQRL